MPLLNALRRWARDGAAGELDLVGTVRAPRPRRAGGMCAPGPRRQNAAKVVLFAAVGGSMDDQVRRVEELFSAARSAFRPLEQFYFHNCLDDGDWRNKARRWT